MQRGILIVMMGIVAALGASMLTGGCAAEPKGPPFDSTTTVSELMAMMVDPAADLVWDAVGTVITEDGADHWEPETDADWLAVQYGAMTITEAGNLLMMEHRARDQETWMRMAQGLIDAGRVALEAAQARDAEAVFDVGEVVYNACDRCHNLYWVGDADRGRAGVETP